MRSILLPSWSPPTWVAALDTAALHAVTDATEWLGGEDRNFLNWVVRHTVDIDTLKLGIPVLLCFWVWVRPAGYSADPVRVLRQVAGVLLAMAVGRGAQILLPDRPRPMQAAQDFPFPDLGHLPFLDDGSSMPSDHAALAFSLAAVVWAGSRRLGVVAFFWAAFGVCLPRLYLGYHHLSDLVAGAAIGVSMVRFALWVPLPFGIEQALEKGARWVDARAPGLATVGLFLIAFECLTLFESSRKIANATVTVAAIALDIEQRTDAEDESSASASTETKIAAETALNADELSGEPAGSPR